MLPHRPTFGNLKSAATLLTNLAPSPPHIPDFHSQSCSPSENHSSHRLPEMIEWPNIGVSRSPHFLVIGCGYDFLPA